MIKFKNISDQELTVPGIGIIKPGEVVDAPADFHNVNFERVETKEDKVEHPAKKEEIKDK